MKPKLVLLKSIECLLLRTVSVRVRYMKNNTNTRIKLYTTTHLQNRSPSRRKESISIRTVTESLKHASFSWTTRCSNQLHMLPERHYFWGTFSCRHVD